jgi:DNA-directed RNA polymerase subunit M/transcription elongation factor TFIIS
MPMATTAPTRVKILFIFANPSIFKLNCKNCDVESIIEGRFLCAVITDYRHLECDKVINVREFSYEKKILDLDEAGADGKDHGVQVDHICTKCGHNQATYSTQQTRQFFVIFFQLIFCF